MTTITNHPDTAPRLAENRAVAQTWEQRRHLRFPVVATADVVSMDMEARHLIGEVSELSPCGCYIDTPEPFAAGTEVRVCIQRSLGNCELFGKVIYVHKGWGMGVKFCGSPIKQIAILNHWLARLAQTIGLGSPRVHSGEIHQLEYSPE